MKRILVLKHMPSQNPGIFREFASDQGIEFFEIDLHAGDQIPDISQFDGLWSMGGSMDVWEEEYPWLAEEEQAIRHAVSELEMPFFGICLGHQLLAEAMGGKVERAQEFEIGLYDVRPTPEGKGHPLMQGLATPGTWVNVHMAEVSEPPKGAIILAESDRCKVHMMQIGELAFSCQFHPEVGDATVDGWMGIPGIPQALAGLLGTEGLEAFKSAIANHLPSHKAAARQLLANWCKLVF
ncbi:MAG: type 1 glutamine amidotransferase [Pseudomonadota bacterium]